VFAQQIPEPPIYGLARNMEGMVIQPERVEEVQEIENSTPLPSIGIVIDF